MSKLTRPFVFRHVYEMAALVESCSENHESLGELDWADRGVVLAAAKFGKVSLLHRYVYAMIAVEHRREYRENADLYEAEAIADLEALLRAYEIGFLPYRSFLSPIPAEAAHRARRILSTNGSSHKSRPSSSFGNG